LAERAALTGHILWNHTEPSFTWLPFLRIRCLHLGQVPMPFSLAVSIDRILTRPALYTSPDPS